MTTFIIPFFIGFLIRSILGMLFTNRYFLNKMREIEVRFLMMLMYFYELKGHATAIVELIYEEKAENDPEAKNTCNLVKQKIDEKYTSVIQAYVKYMSTYIPYKLNYSNIEEALVYVKGVMKEANKGKWDGS